MAVIETAFLDPASMANKERSRQPASGSWPSESRQLAHKSTTRAHHYRESSLSSLGSAGPASPYTTSISNPNVPEYFSAISEWVSGRESKPVPEIDFTLYTDEDGNQCSTREPRSEDTKVQMNPDSSENTIARARVDFGTALSGASSVHKDDESEKIPREKSEVRGEKNWNNPDVHPSPSKKAMPIQAGHSAIENYNFVFPRAEMDIGNSDLTFIHGRTSSEPNPSSLSGSKPQKTTPFGSTRTIRAETRKSWERLDPIHRFRTGRVFKVLWPESKGSYGTELSQTRHFKRKAIRVVINGKECYARPDSASDQDIITEAFAEEHNIPIQREEGDKSDFELGTGSFVQSIGRAYIPFKLFGGGNSEENRWFHVLKKCPVPLIMGMRFLEKFKLYSRNKHLLVNCPSSFGSMPMLKWIGSPRGYVNFKANGKELVGCADTGSDLDFMSLRCARRLGFKIDTEPNARTRVMLADESIVETVGQATVSSVELSYFDGFEMTFHILPGLASDVIFSEAFLDQTDAFNTCVQMEDSEDSYQQRLNTLINFGPVQAWLSRKWTPDAQDTAQQEHDRLIEAELYRRNKADRTIRKMRDENRADAAREAEEANQNTFNTRHARCPHCIGERRGTAA